MLLLIITIFLLILSGSIIYLCYHNDDWYSETLPIISGIIGTLAITALIIEIGILISKPFNYKAFKIKYNVLKEQTTSKDDIRDATFTQNIIEINEEIIWCREYKDSIWIGLYQNEKICNTKLLKKDE